MVLWGDGLNPEDEAYKFGILKLNGFTPYGSPIFIQNKEKQKSDKKTKPSTKVLYVMQNSLGLYKIGISTNADRRLKQVVASSGLPVNLLKQYKTKDARNLEKYLHNNLSHLREKGEWFKGDSGIMDQIDQLIINYQKNNEKSS